MYEKKSFPEKLMHLLSLKSHADVITWFPEGKSFVILEPEKFTRKILPQFFNKTNHDCFTHELYCWGFKCLVGSVRNTAFYHVMFVRDEPDLCKQIKRFNIVVNDDGLNKQTMAAIIRPSDDSVHIDETALSSNVGIDNSITNTFSKPKQVSDDSKAYQDIQDSFWSRNIKSKPWLDEDFIFVSDERAMFHEKLNMNLFMNLKPIMVRREVTKKKFCLLNSKKLDSLYISFQSNILQSIIL